MGNPVETVNFSINGVSHTVNVADYSNHSLASYVREVAGLTGTKVIAIVGNYKINQLKENVTTTQFIIYDYYQVSSISPLDPKTQAEQARRHFLPE